LIILLIRGKNGNLNDTQSHIEDQITDLEKSLRTAKEVSEKTIILLALSSLLLENYRLGKSVESASRCIDLSKESGQEDTLLNASFVYADGMLILGESRKAKEALIGVQFLFETLSEQDRLKFTHLFGLSSFKSDKELGIDILKNGLAEAEVLKDNHWIGLMHCALGELYVYYSHFEDALSNLIQAKDLSEQTQNSNVLERSLTELGITYIRFGDPEKAMTYLFRALEVSEKNLHYYNLAICKLNIGIVYSELKDHEDALNWYTSAAAFLGKYDITRELIACLNNVTFSHMELGHYTRAMKHHKEVIASASQFESKRVHKILYTTLGTINSRLKEYQNAHDILTKVHELPKHKYYTLEITIIKELAKCKLELKKFEELDKLLYEGIAQAELQSSPQDLAAFFDFKYQLAMELGDEKEALKSLETKAKHDEQFSHVELSRRIRNIEQIQELKRQEEKRKMLKMQHEVLADSNEELIHFTESVAHDLKAPLRTISSFTGLLKRENKKLGQTAGLTHLDEISSNASKMETMLNNLLQLALVGTGIGQKEELNVEEVLQNVLSSIDKNKHALKVKLKFKSPIKVLGNRDEFHQLLEALILDIGNEPTRSKRSAIIISGGQDAGYTQLIIADKGTVIDNDRLEELNSFFCADTISTSSQVGLGLAICRKIVKLMDGKIDIETNEKRTNFILKLPLLE
jgi:signal transduction histidine kinase